MKRSQGRKFLATFCLRHKACDVHTEACDVHYKASNGHHKACDKDIP